jgi:hypothetical protein
MSEQTFSPSQCPSPPLPSVASSYDELLTKNKKLRQQLIKAMLKIRQYELDNKNLQFTCALHEESIMYQRGLLNERHEKLKSSTETLNND